MSNLLAVAIDFGTTRVSYMSSSDRLPRQVGRWPGCDNFVHKVPTVLRYTSPTEYEWGFVADRAGFGRSILFKTTLGARVANIPDQSGRSGQEMIRDFLNAIYRHICKHFQGENLGDLEMVFSFTVPATYLEQVVEEYKDIIKETSFSEHKFDVTLTEPEAAAIHTLYTHLENNFVHPHEGIIVCDAGGGTVDVSSYEILQAGRVPRVREMGIISGDFCGSINIDQAFEKKLSEAGILHQISNGEKYQLLQMFIQQKELFTNDPSSPYLNVKLPREGLTGEFIVMEQYFQISREMMIQFFEPSITKTLTLLGGHLRRCHDEGVRVRRIFMAGGFGSSTYLKARILESFGPAIEVIQPPDTVSATVLGCIRDQTRAIRGIPLTVVSRRCPAHYGILVSHSFDPEKHDPRDRYRDEYTGKEIARNQVEWFAKKGDEIRDGSLTIPRQLKRVFKTRSVMWEDILVRCDTDEPPPRLGDAVKVICRLKTDMSKLPISEFQKRTRLMGLKKFYEAHYLVHMIIRPAGLRFQMWYKNALESDLLEIAWERDGCTLASLELDQAPAPARSRVRAFMWGGRRGPPGLPGQAFADRQKNV